MICGDSSGLTVERLLPANLGCPHDYALVPGDLRRLSTADALIRNGLGLDDFLKPALQRLGRKILEINATEGLTPAADLPCDHQHSDHDHHHPVDPHLFASPRQAAGMLQNIAAALCQLDPANESLYRKNLDTTSRRLLKLADNFSALGVQAVNPGIVICHTAFNQLAADSGLKVVALLQSEPGQDPSAAEMLSLIQTIKSQKPAAIFSEPQYSSRIAETISKETSIPHAVLDPVANGPENAAADYYFTQMKANLATLRHLLGVRKSDEPGH